MVGVGAGRGGRGERQRRCDLGGSRARPSRPALGLAGLALRLGRDAGRPRPLLPRPRRGRQRPAGQGRLERRRLLQPRHPARPRAGGLGGRLRPAALLVEPARADRLRHLLRLLAVDRAVLELDHRVGALPGDLLDLAPVLAQERPLHHVVLDPLLVERALHLPARMTPELHPNVRAPMELDRHRPTILPCARSSSTSRDSQRTQRCPSPKATASSCGCWPAGSAGPTSRRSARRRPARCWDTRSPPRLAAGVWCSSTTCPAASASGAGPGTSRPATSSAPLQSSRAGSPSGLAPPRRCPSRTGSTTQPRPTLNRSPAFSARRNAFHAAASSWSGTASSDDCSARSSGAAATTSSRSTPTPGATTPTRTAPSMPP